MCVYESIKHEVNVICNIGFVNVNKNIDIEILI